MKKQNHISRRTLLLCILCTSLAVCCAAQAVAWVQANSQLTAAYEVGSTSTGYTAGFSGGVVAGYEYVYSASTDNAVQTYIPGDVYYYTTLVPVERADLAENTPLQFSVTLACKATATDAAANLTAFLGHLCIRQNGVRAALLCRGTNAGGSTTYTVTPYVYQNGTGTVTVTDFSASSVPALSSTAVTGFSGTGETLTVTIPALPWTSNASLQHLFYTDGGSDYVYVMLYIPIWYCDDGPQNNEMGCSLAVSGCTVTVGE